VRWKREGSPRVAVRKAVPDDAPAIAEIHVASWRAAYRGIVPDETLDGLSVERRTAYWRRLVEAPGDSRVFVATVGDDVVGFASTGPGRDDDLPLGARELYTIYLAPTSWRRGIGRRLLDLAVDDLRDRGHELVVLWVLRDNDRGRRFYEAAGWTADGSSRGLDFGHTAVDEVRYSLQLGRPAGTADGTRRLR
jgi:ribosomal protein S18 acetylase RimI-like enzyme